MVILGEEYEKFLLRTASYFRTVGVTQEVQILQVMSEAGEAADAMIRFRKGNPRKSQLSAIDVAHELADVATTAMVAIIMMGYDPNAILETQKMKTEGRLRDYPA